MRYAITILLRISSAITVPGVVPVWFGCCLVSELHVCIPSVAELIDALVAVSKSFTPFIASLSSAWLVVSSSTSNSQWFPLTQDPYWRYYTHYTWECRQKSLCLLLLMIDKKNRRSGPPWDRSCWSRCTGAIWTWCAGARSCDDSVLVVVTALTVAVVTDPKPTELLGNQVPCYAVFVSAVDSS